jgi:GH24 family phage-related lysozyme (muramidase)
MWLGHKHGYDIHYFRKNFAEIGQEYKKIQYLLTIGEGEETKTIREKLGKQDDKLTSLERQLADERNEKEDIKKEMLTMREEVARLQDPKIWLEEFRKTLQENIKKGDTPEQRYVASILKQ